MKAMDGVVVRCMLIHASLCTFLLTLNAQRTGQRSAYHIAAFQNPDPDPNAKLNHVILHNSNIYIGGVNSLYRLNDQLLLQANVSTEEDCTRDQDGCLNYNKVLFVDPTRNTLITCGSDSEGTCQRRHLDELTVISRSEVIRVSPGRDKTTVSLLAPGPGNRDWLYVATTFISSGTSTVPIARRDLESPDRSLLYTGNSVRFTTDYRSNPFDIHYVYGFTSNNFIFFVTAQQQQQTTRPVFVSKVVRVCQTSDDLDSYTEITLQCGNGPNMYNLAQAAYFGTAGPALAESPGIDPGAPMLFAVFAKNVGSTSTSSDSSALCAFSMADIDNAFETAVSNCVHQGPAYQVPYLDGSKCSRLPLTVDYRLLLCDTEQRYQYARGSDSDGVPAIPLLQLEGTRMSSIVTSIEMNHTVAFIGTSQGTLLKVHIEDGAAARHYETVQLPRSSPVLTDISLNEQMQHINILTEQQFLRLRVENCNQYKSCNSCIGEAGGQDGDPYCGWCTLHKRCTRHSECPLASVSSRWLPYNAAQCVGINQTDPKNLAITDPSQMITLTVDQLPNLKDRESYSCQFDDLPRSAGTTNSNTIQCSTPETGDRPSIPPMEDHVGMRLNVFSSETNINFISGIFNLYDCSRHSSCTPCVTSNWDCDWCVSDNRCTHRSEECSQGEYIVAADNNPDASTMRGQSLCPQLQPQMGEVLVPVGIPKIISVNASNLPDPSQVTKQYQCSLIVDGDEQTTTATLMSDDVIQCDGRMYTYGARKQTFDALLRVVWNGDRRLDDIHNFTVTLYKCDSDRQDCSRCLSSETARPELGCRWCGSRCAFKEDYVCNAGSLDSSDPCPAPHLETVDPPTGPMEGNSIIEISGTNIGRRFQDIRSVMVGQQPCDLTGLGDQYVTGKSVRCRTAPMNPGTPQPITVSVAPVSPPDGAQLTSSGGVSFTYTNPTIGGFSPSKGIEAGGTLITVTGNNLNTGRDIRAVVGTNVTCHIIQSSVTVSSLQCRTGRSIQNNSGRISVVFDGATRTSAELFTFKENPSVLDVQPRKSYQSGGRTLRVNGTGFSFVQVARIFARNGQETFYGVACSIESDWFMECKSPSTTETNTFTLGFLMDGHPLLLSGGEFRYSLDPVFYNFGQSETSNSGNNYLLIKGERLNEALGETEIYVKVGSENCKINVFDSELITCKLPENEPPGLDADGNPDTRIRPLAVVHWYSDQMFTAGEVIYPRNILTIVLATVVPTVGVALLALIVVFIFKYNKQKQLLRTYNERLLALIRHLHEEQQAGRGRRSLGSSDEQRPPVIPAKTVALNANISIVPGDLQIKFSQLDMGKVIGRGAFGIVYQATMNAASSGSERQVAVKTIQDASDSRNVIKFLEEGLMMKNFSHPNVLGLFGLTFDPDGQPLIVLPFMANGDLKSYIVKRKQNPRVRQLVTFALHIARGMKYLSERKFVHRDLAARNCMIDDEEMAKIADFGLSRDLDESDYYTSGDKQAKLPVKWMAPESMERKVYNMKTDVWSYGVLLWELFSGGRQPYPGVRNRDVYDFIMQGRRMDPPGLSPPKTSEIMQQCWKDSPKMRCSFGEIVEELDRLDDVLDDDSSLGGKPEGWNASSDVDGPASIYGAAYCNEPSYLQPAVECATKGGSHHIPMEVIGWGQENDKTVDVDERQKITQSYFSN